MLRACGEQIEQHLLEAKNLGGPWNSQRGKWVTPMEEYMPVGYIRELERESGSRIRHLGLEKKHYL